MGVWFNQTQPLGKWMKELGLRVKDVEAITGISYRTISDYLAGRKRISDKHMAWLCAGLGLEPEDLQPDESE